MLQTTNPQNTDTYLPTIISYAFMHDFQLQICSLWLIMKSTLISVLQKGINVYIVNKHDKHAGSNQICRLIFVWYNIKHITYQSFDNPLLFYRSMNQKKVEKHQLTAVL
jgi:hypothetical protein